MAQSNILNTVVTAGIAALVSVGVYAGLNYVERPRGAAFEQAVRDYLVANPDVLVEMDRALAVQQEAQRQVQRQAALDAVGMEALLDPMVAYVEGPDDAAATIVEFFDYRCGFCKRSLPAIKSVLEERDDVRFAFIEYPILTDQSLIAARAAIAARRQPGLYVPFHLALMETEGELPLERILQIAGEVGLDVEQLQADMEDPSVTETLEASHALAEQLQVSGTPTFVVNGEVRVGQVTEELLESYIDEAAG